MAQKKVTEKQLANLAPFHEITEKEQREIAKKGGKASAKARAERKTLKEQLLLLLAEGDTQQEISVALLQKAMGGDTKAFEVIRDTIGEKPTEKVKVVQRDDTAKQLIDDMIED